MGPVTPSPRESFWKRRVVRPIVAQLTQGATPDRIAATLAAGTVCSIFPFLGLTTVLNLAVGFAWRMNQPILQTLNQVLGVAQLALILVYVRLGELIWGATGTTFTVAEMIRVARDASVSTFLQRFGWAGVHAFTAWALTAPLLLAAIYFSVRPLLRRWRPPTRT